MVQKKWSHRIPGPKGTSVKVVERLGILDPQSSWMLDLIRSSHPTVSWKESDSMFQFDLLSSHRDPLTRQTYEAVRIQQAFETGTITVGESDLQVRTMNRRGEHFAPRERWITHN